MPARTLNALLALTRPLTAKERRILVETPLRIVCHTFPGRSHGGHSHYDEEGQKVFTPNSYNARSFGQDLISQD